MADDAVAVADAPSTPPIPADISQVDVSPDAGDSASPPEWSTALQRESMKRANFEKKVEQQFGQLLEAINGVKSGPASQVPDELAEAEQALVALEDSSPEIARAIKPLLSRLKKGQANPQDASKLAEIERKLQSRDAYEDFWSARPPEHRREYEKKMTQMRSRGYSGERLQGVMDDWIEDFEKKAKKPAPPAPAPSGGIPRTSATGTRVSADEAGSIEAAKQKAQASGRSFYRS